MADTLVRGATQVLYRHMPESMIWYTPKKLLGKVSTILSDRDDEIEPEVLFERLHFELTRHWQNSRGFPDPSTGLNSTFIAVRRVSAVQLEVWPRVFQCNKTECRIVRRFYNLRNNQVRDGRCSHCHRGLLQQIPYVYVHTCGNIREVVPLRQVACPTHGERDLYLDDRRSFQSSVWRCRACETQGRSHIRGMAFMPCSCGSGEPMRGTYYAANAVYYVQTIDFVNFPREILNRLRFDDDNDRLLLLGCLLGVVDLSSYRLSEIMLDSQTGKNIQIIEGLRRQVQEMEEFKKNHSDSSLRVFIDQQIQQLWENIKALTPASGNREATLQMVRQQNPTPKAVSAVTRHGSITTYALIKGTLEDIYDIPTRRAYLETEGLSDLGLGLDSAKAFSELLGLEEVILIPNFPVALAAFGYTRLQSEPAVDVTLCSFPTITDQGRSKIPIYTIAGTPDAMLFRLKASRVVAWLYQNRFLSSHPPNFRNEQEALLWFVDRYGHLDIPSIDFQSIDDKAVYTLLHTFSHLCLRRIAITAGLEPMSLTEILLPTALSFAMYSAGKTEFTLGTLTTVFDQRLEITLQEMVRDGLECIFDPICTELQQGACPGCTYIQLSCKRYNHDLSRILLYGGNWDGQQIAGFWSPAIMNM